MGKKEKQAACVVAPIEIEPVEDTFRVFVVPFVATIEAPVPAFDTLSGLSLSEPFSILIVTSGVPPVCAKFVLFWKVMPWDAFELSTNELEAEIEYWFSSPVELLSTPMAWVSVPPLMKFWACVLGLSHWPPKKEVRPVDVEELERIYRL